MIENAVVNVIGLNREVHLPSFEGWWHGLDENVKARRIIGRFKLRAQDCAIYTFALSDVDDDIVTAEINAHTKSQITALHSLHHSSGEQKYVKKCPYHAHTNTIA